MANNKKAKTSKKTNKQLSANTAVRSLTSNFSNLSVPKGVPKTLSWIAAGAVVGAAIGYFMDPALGRRRRRKVTEGLNSFGTGAGEQLREINSKVMDFVSMGFGGQSKAGGKPIELENSDYRSH